MPSNRVIKFLGCNDLTTERDIWKALIAEFVGTLFLVLIGCGSCIKVEKNDNSTTDLVQISLAFGVTVATMVQCICHISGGHINPAVTLSMLATCKVSLVRALFYIICQCVGGITGAALLLALTPHPGTLGLSKVTKVANDGSSLVTDVQAFGIEFLITFVLVLTVFAVCDGNRTDVKGSAPLAIGLAVTTCHLFAVPFTGAGMNPARTLGPAVIGNQWDDHWVYWAGPCLGGIAAGLLYHLAFRAPSPLISVSRFESFNKESERLKPVDT